MARSNFKEYDFLLIYNHEGSSYSDGDTREDSSLLLKYVDFIDRELKSCKYSIHHLDRDSIPGRSVFYELDRVIESSQVILLILDKGFLKNSWKCFSQEAAIKNLIDASTDPKCTTSNRLIPIFICLEKNEIPSALKTLTPIEIMGESDITDKWRNLKKAIDCHIKEGRIPRGIVAKNSKYSQLTPEYASAVSKEPRSNPISNGPSSRSAILPNQNTVNTQDSLSTGSNICNNKTITNIMNIKVSYRCAISFRKFQFCTGGHLVAEK